jgi:hypothetical protein
MLAFLLAGS